MALALGPLAAERDGAPAWEAPALLALDFRLWTQAPREALAQLLTALGAMLRKMGPAEAALLGGLYVLRHLCELGSGASAADPAFKAIRIGARRSAGPSSERCRLKDTLPRLFGARGE